jgi:hypothetical protein
VSDGTIGHMLTAHYAEHGLPPDGGEHQAWFHVKVGALSIPVPNPPARRRAVFFHDVNHLLTGYNTTFSEGEMEIAGFEVGAGCGPYLIAWFINLFMMALGLVVRPRAVLRAFRWGRRSGSIYRDGGDRARIRGMTTGELRAALHIDMTHGPPGGIA